MYFTDSALPGVILSYIDPNNMHHFFTFLGPLLVFFSAVAGIAASIVYFLRGRLRAWFQTASGVKLVMIWTGLVSGLIVVVFAVCKLFLHLKAI